MTNRHSPQHPKRGIKIRSGFTLLELTVVMALAATMLAFATLAFMDLGGRTSARSAAQVFARDLALARSAARRGNERVVFHFYESSRWYTVTTETGQELARRRFGPGEDMNLSALVLELAGDSLVFDRRGMADLGGSLLGEALFISASDTFEVSFNALGASKVEAR